MLVKDRAESEPALAGQSAEMLASNTGTASSLSTELNKPPKLNGLPSDKLEQLALQTELNFHGLCPSAILTLCLVFGFVTLGRHLQAWIQSGCSDTVTPPFSTVWGGGHSSQALVLRAQGR